MMAKTPADAARERVSAFITRKSKGGTVQFDPPISREILGKPPVQVHNRCMMEGCGHGFYSDRFEIICDSCKHTVALAEAAVKDLPAGNLPQGMTRLARAIPARRK